MLHKFRAARAAQKQAVAPAPTPAPPAGPATVESLGQQLREVLPARRLQSVSLCDHEANVLWLSEGALGPDEHLLVMEALEILKADSSLPCHETALEDGRLGVFLPVRAPTGALVGVAMILADSKSVGDDTLERMTAAPVRTIMQRLAVLLKPSGLLGAAPIPVELPDEIAEPLAQPEEAVEAIDLPAPDVVELELVSESEVELEVEAALPPAAAPLESESDDISETIITAAEIASILELELVPDEPPPAPAASTAKPAAPAAVAVTVAAAVAPAAAPAPPVVPAAPAAAQASTADSGMVKLEFLAEPPVVRPPQNPSAVARKLQAASKAAEVAPTRAPRALPPPPARAPAAAAIPPAKGKNPAPAPPAKATPTAPAAPAATRPAQPPAAQPASAPTPSPQSLGPVRNPFEPVPPHSRLSLNTSDDDVVVLFESEPVTVPQRPGALSKAPPAKTAAGAAQPAPPLRAAPPPPKPAQPTRIQPVTRVPPPARSAPAVRNLQPPPAPVAAPPAVPAARTPPPAPAPVVLPAAVAAPTAPVAAPAAPVAAPAVAVPVVVPVAPAPGETSPAIDLVPFARLRAGGQNRRFQVQPRAAAAQRDPAADEQMMQELLAWLGKHRALWNSVPTTFTVNLSIATLEDERFLGKIGAALNTHGISGETLGFEIAESLCAQQRVKVERFIAQCEKIGAWVAIDDFSFDSQVLPLLRSKALRLLKLDARLSAAALRDKLSQAMLVATVQAAKVLGIHTSAKKADSPASLQYLTAIGLDYAQGAALARTVPLEAIGSALEPGVGGAGESQ